MLPSSNQEKNAMPTMTAAIPDKIVPIKADFLLKARQAGFDDQNQAVEKHIAEGGEPCRDALRRAMPGEALILASYTPFEVSGPYKEYGPVFIQAEASPEPVDMSRLPITPQSEYLGKMFVLRAYSKDERIMDGFVVASEEAEVQLQDLLAREDVAFVLVRFAGYGCYACRIERA